jgi:Autographiviridae endonuclease VII
VELLTTVSNTRGPVPTVGRGLCISAYACATHVTGSKEFASGYNQTADGEAHNLADAGATPAPVTKICQRCKNAKALSEFHVDNRRKDGLCRICKDCTRAYHKTWVNNNPEKAREKWRRAAKSGSRRRSLRFRYGIDEQRYTELLIEQNYKCAICHSDNSGRVLHVDHSHETGIVRGLLCAHCNQALGLFREDITRIAAAIDYVQFHRTNPIGTRPDQPSQ